MRKIASYQITVIVLLGSGCVPIVPTRTIERPSPAVIADPTPTARAEIIDPVGITVDGYPRVDGSTSTYPLQFMVACELLDVHCSWVQGNPFDPLRKVVPDVADLELGKAEMLFNMHHNGTHDAYINLIFETTDLILVAREPSDDELNAAWAQSVKLDVRPVAKDAFVFLVHADNPVKSLTMDQIRDIFTGRITNWMAVGGPDSEIHTYQRNRNSGSQELMEKLVMYGEPMLDSPDMILESMIGPINAIRDDPLGIGYSVYFYAENIYPDENVRIIPVAGILPTSETIAGGSYPLSTDVHVVVREEPPESESAILLRDWLLTEPGQDSVKASGYIGISG